MDILSGDDSIEEMHKSITQAFEEETAEQSAEEFRGQVRLNAYQKAFAQSFAGRARVAWSDLLFLQPVALQWVAHQMRDQTGTGDGKDKMAAIKERGLLDLGVKRWMVKYGIDASWIYATTITTLRAAALHEFFSVDPPSTLLHNTFPTLSIKDGNIELGTSSFEPEPWSVVIVDAGLGPQEWDTTAESKSAFRKRMREEFLARLDSQLDQVDNPLLTDDLDVKTHWIDMTIDRYAGHLSERATAQLHGVSLPAVTKAVEATRLLLGFKPLPSDWHATRPKPWKLHAT